jgi:hypothetical protein
MATITVGSDIIKAPVAGGRRYWQMYYTSTEKYGQLMSLLYAKDTVNILINIDILINRF